MSAPTAEFDLREMHEHPIASRSWVTPEGRATPVVMLHGLGVASRMCRPVAERLAPTRPVHAPDLPGFGDSNTVGRAVGVEELATATAAWIRSSRLEGCVLAGVSLGAQIAAIVAATHPELASAVVLASPIVQPDRRTWRQQVVRWVREGNTQTFEFRRLMVSDYARCGIGRVVRTFSDALEVPTEKYVGQLRTPTLVLHGTNDPLVSHEWAAELAASAPHISLVTLPGVTHAMSYLNPVEMARAMEHHLAGLEQRHINLSTGTG